MFENLLSVLRTDLEAREQHLLSANSSFSSSTAISATAAAPPTTEARVHSNPSLASQSSDGKPPKVKEMADRQADYGLVWIMYMRFGKRAEGLKAMRSIFAKARKDRLIPWTVYEAAGTLTVDCTR
jgi:cleavage stimulation factor subunit 3